MKKITFLLMMLLTALSMNAQTSYGNSVTGNAGTTGGDHSSYFGYQAGKVSTGAYNTFLGSRAGIVNTTGKSNVFVGNGAGYISKNGHYNVFVGNSTGRYSVGGDRNTYIGFQAGYKNKVNGNVFLGYKAGYNELGSDKLYIDNTTTSSPLIYGDFSSNELTIHGKLDVSSPNGENALDLWSSDNAGWNNQIRFFSTEGGGELRHVIADDYANDRLLIFPGYGPSASRVLHVNGSMLIGQSNTPSGYKLYVGGGILADRVKVATVNSSNWSDYVFAEDYHLNSTEEVEEFIKENKHLPNVPSAKEVSENGVDMVEMDATLLRQIEELWLHVIKLKKDNENLNVENEILKTRVNALENK